MAASRAFRYLLGVSISTIACAAWAQQPAGAVQAAPAAAGDSSSKVLEEIIVTANRRAERSQDVPIAVTALTASTMASAGVTGTTSLVSAVPSLNVETRANGASPFLRGIGATNGDVNAESSVAIYVDGVYQPISEGNFFDFNDVERIEVLKGPQGTLFGRNATGGVIQVITKDPTFKPAMSFNIGYANYRTPSADFYASTGIGDKVAVNVAVMYKDQEDGWGRNLTNGQDIFLGKSYSVRSKLLFKPDDDTKIILAGDYFHRHDSALSGQPPFGLSGAPNGISSPAYASANTIGQGYPGRYNTYSNFIDGTTTNNRGVSLHIEHDFGSMQFRSISAYRKFNGLWDLDQDLSPLSVINVDVTEYAKTLSQEVHLYAEPESKLQWLVGAYYFRNNGAFDPVHLNSSLPFPPFSAFAPLTDLYGFYRSVASSVSVFGQATYPIADRLRLTLGGRYTWDRARFNGQQLGTIPGLGSIVVVAPNQGRNSYSRPTWRASLDYKIAPDVLAYVSYNRGSKSGNFSVSIPVAAQALYFPEKLDAFETGLKSEFFEHRLRLNLSGFYYKYENLQFQKLVVGGSQTVNGNAKLYGAELEMTGRPMDGLTINANIAYLHGRIGDFPNAPATARIANGTDAGVAGYNADGNRTPNSPRLAGNIGFNYSIPAAIGSFDLSSNVYYTQKYAAEIDNRLWIQAHPLVSAGLKWTDKSGAVSASLWGKNLTNEYYYAQLNGTAGITDLGSPAPPRTYGITLGYKYK